jgi:hypothetical protein
MFGIKNPSVGYSGCITVYVVFIWPIVIG